MNAQREFASKLTLMMNEAMRLGLYRTMHKLHDAVREVGWELADIAKKEQQPKDSRYEARAAISAQAQGGEAKEPT